MSGRHQRTMRRLVVATLVIHALSVAGLSPSHGAARAAAANPSGTGLVNEMPCNDLCKAYMAWSDRTMARLNPAQRQAPPRPRTAAHAKRPELPPHHAAATRRPDLNSFARPLRQIDSTPQPAAPLPVEIAAPRPADAITDQTSAAGGAAEQRADTGATTELAETMPMSVADPLPATPEPVTIGHIANGPPRRFPVSLALALCALLAFGSWWWIRDRMQAADAIQ